MPLRPLAILSVAALVSCVAAASVVAQTGSMSDAEMQSFVAQSVCVDTNGAPTAYMLLVCSGTIRQQTETDPVYWRRSDWPETNGPAAGYQISDSVLAVRSGHPITVQTFDFGDAGRLFGDLNSVSDGGDALIISNGVAAIFLTQDGGTPGSLQWFLSKACKRGGLAAEQGWVSFRSDVQSGSWQNIVTKLKDVSSGAIKPPCPQSYNVAYTRYRRETINFPFRGALNAIVPLDVIVSEHYGGKSIKRASSLERFYYAKGWGKVRWESWQLGPFGDDLSARLSTRCPQVDYSVPPAAGWTMRDCRMWTNIIAQPGNWSVAQFGWPPALSGF